MIDEEEREKRVDLPLLPGGVPDLRLDGLVVDDKRPGLELDPDGGLGVEAELVAGEARQDLRLADSGVADEHHLEDVVNLIPAPRHRLLPPLLAPAVSLVSNESDGGGTDE